MNSEPDHCEPSTAVRLLLTGLVFNALLVLPAWWRDGAIGSVWLVPEAWLVPALVGLLPRRSAALARTLLAAGLTLAIVAGFFDGLLRSVLSRPLNAFLDILMLEAGFHLIAGSMGGLAAVAACILLALTVFGLGWLSWRLLRSGPGQRQGAFVSVLVAGLLLSLSSPKLPGVETVVIKLLRQQASQLDDALTARARLVEAATDPVYRARPLPGLDGRDVYLVFIESYGMDALEQTPYAERLRPVLKQWQQRLDAGGLKSVSGQFEAPIRGGQSWLSHATVLSGLRVDNQLWYRMLLAGDIDLLSDDFRATGHVPINVSPAITMAWPEGERLGFEQRHTARNMPYSGPPLGWVTMPDQYTLFHTAERIRPQIDGAVFAQIALISSHWPWTPVIEVLPDWASIDRGQAFERWRNAGDSALSMWLRPDRMRRNYPASLAYSLEVTLDWARRYLPENGLLIVLGDHQASSIITGRDASAAVPVHIISDDPDLLAPFLERGFSTGLSPGAMDPLPGSERLRHWLRDDFGHRPPFGTGRSMNR